MAAGTDEPSPTADESAADETIKQEVAEMEETLNHTTMSRPSVVSKARYNKWAVAETTRQQGEQSRAEWEALEAQRLQSTTEFIEAGHDRTQAAREQREHAAERVRQHKADMQEKAIEAKRELEERKQADARKKQAWTEHTAKLAQVHGSEQRERTLESRTERFESRRNAAADAKQAEADRAAEYASALMRKLDEKRQRVAAIRAQTQPEVAREAKEQFLQQRRDTANDVRTSVRDWKAEKQFNHQQALAKAHIHRKNAISSRGNAIEHRNVLIEARRQDASAMRSGLQAIKDRKQHQKLSLELKKREAHDENFEQRFVSAQQAETLVASSYDSLSNTHRDELAAREGRPARIIGKPNWMPFFATVRGGWFGGQHIDSAAL